MSARLSKKPPSMGRITPSWWSSWLKADLIKFGKVDSKTFWGVGIVVAVLAVYVGYLFWIQYSSGKKGVSCVSDQPRFTSTFQTHRLPSPHFPKTATKSSKKAPTAAAKVASPKRERSSSKSKKAASPAPAPSPEKASPDKASPAKASKSRSRSKTPAKKGK